MKTFAEWQRLKKMRVLGFSYSFVSTLTVKKTCTASAVKLLSPASEHLWMTSGLASQKQSAEFLTKLAQLLSL